jgi:hypothetical protein
MYVVIDVYVCIYVCVYKCIYGLCMYVCINLPDVREVSLARLLQHTVVVHIVAAVVDNCTLQRGGNTHYSIGGGD